MTRPVAEWVLETDRVRVHLRGPFGEGGTLRIQALRAGAAPTPAGPADPALLEGAAYAALVQSKTAAPVRLQHDSLPRFGGDPVLTSRLTAADGGRTWHGPIRLGAVAGRTRFRLDVDGVPEASFALDVQPTRLHPQRDLGPMRREVEETLAGFAFRYLRPADVPAQERHGDAAPATALRLLLATLDDLERALATVGRQPLSDLERTRQVVPAARIRRPDAALARAVRQGKGAGAWTAGAVPIRERVPESTARPTADTPEHRWLRDRLRATRQSVQQIASDEARRTPSLRRRHALRDLALAERRLGYLLRAEPLAAAGSPPGAVTPRLLRAPGYAEAYAACRRLRLSLDLAGGPGSAPLVELHELYEVWTYLAVLRAVARVLGQPVDPASFVRADPVGLRLAVRAGHAHAVRFAGPVAVAYQPRFGGGLLAQRPDLLLTIGKGEERRRYVLDAKYRLDDAAGYVRRHGSAGPPEDALGDLHRYRDAIVERGRRTVREAVALFPLREAEPGAFGQSRLWQSIGTLGVGAIPLLPGETGYLERWLRRVLSLPRGT